MMFYRRDTHVIEIQTGRPAVRLEDACAPDHFDIVKTPYITLLGEISYLHSHLFIEIGGAKHFISNNYKL